MDYNEIIEDLKDVKQRYGIYYVGGGSFTLASAFLSGYFWRRINDNNFREWLVLKTGYHYDNAWWTDLVLELVFPGMNVFMNSVPDEDLARNCLFDLVIEYVTDWEAKGEERIHQEYCKMRDEYRKENGIEPF